MGGSAAAALESLARLRAQVSAKRQEELDARQREYQDQLAQFSGSCRQCLDTGRVWGQESWCICARGVERAEAERLRLAGAVLERARIPAGYAGYTLETFPQRKAASTMERFSLGWDHHQGLVITGPVGVGKTSLLVSTIRRLVEDELARDIRSPIRARFVKTSQFLADLRAAMEQREYALVLDDALMVRLWTLDDLARTTYTDWELGQLFDVIDRRYSQRLPLFVTTNFDQDQLRARLNDAIVDRLADSCLWVTLTGGSRRKRQPQLVF